MKRSTPRLNGKVERSNRKNNEYFYAIHSFYSLGDYLWISMKLTKKRYL